MQAKDIYLANNYKKDTVNPSPVGVVLKRRDGKYNTKRFKNAFDYSLDLIKLRDIYYKVYRNRRFSFQDDTGKEYSKYVINVNFDYNVNIFNHISDSLYVRVGYSQEQIELNDRVCVQDGQLIAIEVDTEFKKPISPTLLCNNFYIENNQYKSKVQTHVFKTVAELRSELYTNGFWCDGTHYVRFKRSAGSARVGKCLFIDEKLYPMMNKWQTLGLKIKENQEIDLASYEACISLSLSSIIDTIKIEPKNILVIDDYESVFKDNVAVCELDKNNHLITTQKEIEISNSIFDGQSLMDISLFGRYKNKGMLLLRNRFFKSCCFNSNIQQWFADNNITDVKQLNGFTLADNIEDVKLITTPSSIKFLKFGKLKQWLAKIDKQFGVVKYEKPPKHFEGKMVECHYQLLNTLQLSEEEVHELIKPNIEYLELIKKYPAVLKKHIKYTGDINQLRNANPDLSVGYSTTKSNIVYKFLNLNEKFANTKIYKDFRKDLLQSIIRRMRRGHLLINGNYSTICGNPIEMLLHSIGKFHGDTQIGVGNIYSTRFQFNKMILGTRSPHICSGNVLLAYNKYNEEINKYINVTDQIVVINSINENILMRLNGCDFD